VISRIEEAFRKLKKKGKKAFIPYIMAEIHPGKDKGCGSHV
jgi:tryptophan synthase alpha subunit